MSEQDPEIAQSVPSDDAGPSEENLPAGMGYLMFVFGIGAGFLLSVFWGDFFGKTLSTIVSIFVVALLVLGGLVLLFFVFRKRLLNYLFNVTQTQLASFAEPLTEVTRYALKKDADGATAAARRLVQLSLARYAWLSTRRWIVASLTALIAAMAALGGTTLLFRQNQLLEQQSTLLEGQNLRLSEQNRLITLDINLAEATRNAALVVEITAIAGELGKVTKRLSVDGKVDNTKTIVERTAAFLPIIADPMREISSGLVARIVSASLATRPYKFLSSGADPRDQKARLNQAFLLRPDLAIQTKITINTAPVRAELIERAVSPERGQLLAVMLKSGIHSTEWLNFNGLDLSFAKVEIELISYVTFFGARLAFADFSYVEIGGNDFGGATIDNGWFRKSIIFDTSFASVDGTKVPRPFKKTQGWINTFCSGCDFPGSALIQTRFDRARVSAARFDNAVLSSVTFKGTSLPGASFKNAVLLDVDFSGAFLHSVEFDGAIVFDKDFLKKLNKVSAPKSFKLDRFVLEPATKKQLLDHTAAYAQIGVRIPESKVFDRPIFRIKRVGEFGK